MGKEEPYTAILGAGLTGLTAAHTLSKRGVPVRVLEANKWIGGASRTVRHGDFRFDLGGHRLYTRNQQVLDLLDRLLGDELLTVPRLSRIFLHGKFTSYPLTFFSALSALGPLESVGVAASYAIERGKRLFGNPKEETFEDWVVSRFGRRLYEIYFKPYSEKVWGVPCDELGADFAAERIKGLSLREAVKNMFFRKNAPETLASRFLYPARGFGRICEAMADTLPDGSIELNSPVAEVRHDGHRVREVVCRNGEREQTVEVENAVSTIPVTELVGALRPAPPPEVIEAAQGLRFRDLVVVFLTLDRPQVTPDHWIYFSSDDVFFGRIHEPKNWSAAMAPEDRTGLVVEIFCFRTDPVWSEADDSLADRTAKRLADLGLISREEVSDATVVRLRHAYPLYIPGYRERMDAILRHLAPLKNLHLAGRNGLYRYTSGDYYMEMGLKAAENVMGADHDLQRVGATEEYAEK